MNVGTPGTAFDQSPGQNNLSQKQREEMILARVRRSPAYKGN